MDPCGASEWPWIINTRTYTETHKGAKKGRSADSTVSAERRAALDEMKPKEHETQKEPKWHKHGNLTGITSGCSVATLWNVTLGLEQATHIERVLRTCKYKYICVCTVTVRTFHRTYVLTGHQQAVKRLT